MSGIYVELPDFLKMKVDEESEKTGKKKKRIYEDALKKYFEMW